MALVLDYYPTHEWARVADYYQAVADSRRIQEVRVRDERRQVRRGALAGAGIGAVVTAVGILLNYMTGGAPIW